MIEVKDLYTVVQTKIYFEAFFNSPAFVLNRLSPKHFQNALI